MDNNPVHKMRVDSTDFPPPEAEIAVPYSRQVDAIINGCQHVLPDAAGSSTELGSSTVNLPPLARISTPNEIAALEKILRGLKEDPTTLCSNIIGGAYFHQENPLMLLPRYIKELRQDNNVAQLEALHESLLVGINGYIDRQEEYSIDSQAMRTLRMGDLKLLAYTAILD